MKVILLVSLLTGPFSMLSVSDQDIKIEIFAPNCVKVADFTAISVVIPEADYMIYYDRDYSQIRKIWKLDGMQEVRISYRKNQWYFVIDKYGNLQEAESGTCAMAI